MKNSKLFFVGAAIVCFSTSILAIASGISSNTVFSSIILIASGVLALTGAFTNKIEA